MKALIITPTGCPLYFDPAYDKDNHWRFTKPERTYETLVISFNDFMPEEGTYDRLVKRQGMKYKIIPHVAREIDLSQYDYIGCWDDDYCTDIQNVNRALELARKNDFALFQQSIISTNYFEVLKHRPGVSYTLTDFVESGIPFFRRDMFIKLLDFLDEYDYEVCEWGIDIVMCHFMRTYAHVIHESHAKHMREESWYDKDAAYKQAWYLLLDFFPKYMKKHYGVDWKWSQKQTEFYEVLQRQL